MADWRHQLSGLIQATEKNLAALRHAVTTDDVCSRLPSDTQAPRKVRGAVQHCGSAATGRGVPPPPTQLPNNRSPPPRVVTATSLATPRAPVHTHPSHALQHPPSYALLRQGVSPRDPHLIAPAHAALPDGRYSPELIPPFYPPPRRTSSGPPVQPCTPPLAPSPTDQGLDRLQGELAAMRASALGWQQVASAVAGVDSSCTARLGELTASVTGLQTAQGRLEEGGAIRERETQGRLTALSGRVEALAATVATAAAADSDRAGAAAPTDPDLDDRLAQTQAALAELQNRIEQQVASVAAAAEAHGNSAAEATAAAAAATAAVASLQAAAAGLRAAQESAAEREEAQQQEIQRVTSELVALQSSQGEASQQAAAQQALLCAQVAELKAEQAAACDAAQQQACRMEQLAAQLMGLAAAAEQQQEVAGSVSPTAFQDLAGEVAASTSAIGDLQVKVSEEKVPEPNG